MLSKYFLPFCVKPIYLFDNAINARKCGFMNGIIYSVIATIVLCILYVKYVMNHDRSNKNILFTLFVGVLVVIWIFFPLSFSHSNYIMYQGFFDTVNSLMEKDGLTRVQAISVVSSFYNSDSGIQLGLLQSVSGSGLLANKKPTASIEKTTGNEPIIPCACG